MSKSQYGIYHVMRVCLQARNAAQAVLPLEEGLGQTGDWGVCQTLMEELSDALYELALTNLRRVASMCVAPSGLACWALELLEEQACQVNLFHFPSPFFTDKCCALKGF